ncbi:MAG: D-alanine-D-alanine ligase, D-alanine-D-alanine ligase [Candidatus Peregrinibacteria bacterium GW2011_GWF2_38_29]|nr:MAG: D-alanine-D-alanine ligase, D-alanine-D-alanine ligase [Candidatus Peregrinibacteria bacterium GW2011_GWF2_38_29]HBB02408.1 hypothetical protein [Candidatus Peregrinibacteria bacterium]
MKFQPPYVEKFKILVIYNVVEKLLYGSEKDKMAEEDTVAQARIVAETLKEAGHTVFEMEVYDNFAEEILQWKDKVDLVFNLTEGVGNDILKAPYVPFILESVGMPFTGCGWESILLALNKIKSKEFVSAYGVLTPDYRVYNEVPLTMPRIAFPLIVKPALAESSYGIDKNAVVHSFKQLAERIQYVLEVYKMPALVESFIDGMDVSVAVLGNDYDNLNVMLPHAVVYKNLPHDEYPIQTFDSKFDTESHLYKNSYVVYPAPLDSTTIENLQAIASKVYRICGCSGYARFDFRIDKNMNPYFLELNTNPGIDPPTGFARAVQDIGLDYKGFMDRIARLAYEKKLSIYKN